MIRLGNLDYINILPVMQYLPEMLREEQPDACELVGGEPCRVNRLLAEGRLDASPISSIEYARHQDELVVLPDLAIASEGAVRSVMLFSWLPLDQLDGQVVGVSGATATSVVLLQILLEDFVGVTPVLQRDGCAAELEDGDYPALLLIGDAALALRARCREHGLVLYEFDLGQMWHDFTRLPFVFALWAARPVPGNQAALRRLAQALQRSRDRGVTLPRELLDEAGRRTGMTRAELEAYYGGLQYGLDERALQGLLAFYERASRKGLCPPCRRVRMLERMAAVRG